MAFSHSGAALATAAPDGQCLLWQPPSASAVPTVAASGGAAHMPPPISVQKPAFTLFKLMGGGKSKSRRKPRKDAGPQWRCVAMPADAPSQPRTPPPLYGALNHQGGPGWVCLNDGASGKAIKVARATSSMLTAIAVSRDARLVSCKDHLTQNPLDIDPL